MTPEEEELVQQDIDYIRTKWIKANVALAEGDYGTAHHLIAKMESTAKTLPGVVWPEA